jgi:putative endonuclease
MTLLQKLRAIGWPRRRRQVSHVLFGESGERAAREYLKFFAAYRVMAHNYRVQVGRGLRGQPVFGEIDVIAYDGDVLAFVEVKTRASTSVAPPERAVGLRKQRQIARAARRYRYTMGVVEERHRYDVITVVPQPDGYAIELLRGYFDDSVFNRGRFFNREEHY